MFRRLNKDELRELTGRKRRADVRKWLDSAGWLYEIDADGWPIVSDAYAESRFSGAPKAKRGPNFAALEKAA